MNSRFVFGSLLCIAGVALSCSHNIQKEAGVLPQASSTRLRHYTNHLDQFIEPTYINFNNRDTESLIIIWKQRMRNV